VLWRDKQFRFAVHVLWPRVPELWTLVAAAHAMRQFTIILESKGSGEAQRFFVWVVSGFVDAQSFEQHRPTAERIIGPAFRKAAEFSADSTERVLASSGASVQRITTSHE